MKLEHKIAQLFIIGFKGATLAEASTIAEDIAMHHLGGVILFDKCLVEKKPDRNILNPHQVAKLNADLQSLSQTPLIISVDYEGGNVNRLPKSRGFVDVPTAVELIALPLEQVKNEFANMARRLRELGFNCNFAPCVDLNINKDNPIIGQLDRSFGHEAPDVIRYATLFRQALSAEGIISCYKHFPGHGSSTADSHLGLVDISKSWQLNELLPYFDLVKTHPADTMIMTAHVVNESLDPDKLPATLSRRILTELLREELGYQGIILSDDLQMAALAAEYSLEDILTHTINAGADMFIVGNQLTDKMWSVRDLVSTVMSLLDNQLIQESQIEKAYQRVTRLKQVLSKEVVNAD